VNTNTLEALDWCLRGLELKAESYRRAAAKVDRPSTRGWCEGKAEAFEEAAKELRELLRRARMRELDEEVGVGLTYPGSDEA